MNILADENVETAMVEWLRQTGHDVAWAAEVFPAEPDPHILTAALQSSRILLTRDLDFGELIYREGRAAGGIILVRIRARNQRERLPFFQHLWPQIEIQAPGHFLVVTNHQVRIRALHSPTE